MTEESMVVRRNELQAVIELLLDRVFGEESALELPHDHYWSLVAREELFVIDEPPEMAVGLLSYDLQRLREMLREPELAVGYGLTWVASVLRALAVERGA